MNLFSMEENVDVYTAVIKIVTQFDLVMDYVDIGISFGKTAEAIQKARSRTKIAKLAGLNHCIIGQYTRVLIAVALQMMDMFIDDPSVWLMLLGWQRQHSNDSTRRDQSCFDPRACMYYRGVMTNLHLLALPIFKRHFAANIIIKFMDVLNGKRQAKRIDVSSDDE